MRSRTMSDLPGRCPRCWIRTSFCICADVQPVATRTEVIIVRHEREGWKSTGTARVALQALTRSRLVEYSEDGAQSDAALAALAGDAALLFPETGVEAGPLHETPARLIVLDGTWRQTRRMLKRLPSLAAVPRLVLPPKAEAPLRLRESEDPRGRSTLEAIADALGMLEGEAASAPLHALHALFVERVFRARGVWIMKSRVLALSDENTQTNVSALEDEESDDGEAPARQHPLPWVLFGVAAMLLVVVGGLLARRLNTETRRANEEIEKSAQLKAQLEQLSKGQGDVDKRVADAEAKAKAAEDAATETATKLKAVEAERDKLQKELAAASKGGDAAGTKEPTPKKGKTAKKGKKKKKKR
jgi:DTW domain-containing protein YfiP